MMKLRKSTRQRPSRRADDADAFLPDPEDGPARTRDDLAQELAEDFLRSATSGEYVSEDALDQEVPEESGGPFVVHSARYEFAMDVDASNPADAAREPLPTPMRAR
jgi:hypothetical protein